MKKRSKYFALQMFVGLYLLILRLFTFMVIFNEFKIAGYREDYRRFIVFQGVFLILSFFLCYPDSQKTRCYQIIYCILFSSIHFFIVYANNHFGTTEIGLLILAGILYHFYDLPRQVPFYISLSLITLFLILMRMYIIDRGVYLGAALIYPLIILPFVLKGSIHQYQAVSDKPFHDVENLPSMTDDYCSREQIESYLSSLTQFKIFSTFEIQLMSEYYCSDGNATNKELSTALDVSESLIKNSISSVFKKVPEIHTRIGMYHYVQQHVMSMIHPSHNDVKSTQTDYPADTAE